MPSEAVSLIGSSPSSEPGAVSTGVASTTPQRASVRPVQIALASARTLEIGGAGASFRLRAPDGSVELSVRVTAEGPVLTFAAASIEVADTKSFKVDVESLTLRARDLRIEVTGDAEQTVAGDSITHCAGRHELQADAVKLVSHGDTMVLDATHDLAINGERVLINC